MQSVLQQPVFAKAQPACSISAPLAQLCPPPLRSSRQAFRVGTQRLRSQAQRIDGRRGRQQAGQVVRSVLDVTEADFEEQVLKADVPVLVDFWATWCGPCKLIAPLMTGIEQEMKGAVKVVKVEADPCPNLVEKYKVYGLPTLILFKDGKVIEGSQQEGAIGKDKLLKYLEQHGVAPVAK